MEPHEVHVLAATVPCGVEKIVNAGKARFPGEFVGHVAKLDFLDRIDDDMTVVHRVLAANLDPRAKPDAHAASNAPSANTFPEVACEDHRR